MASENKISFYCSDFNKYIDEFDHQCNKRNNNKRRSKNPMKYLNLENDSDKELLFYLHCRAIKKKISQVTELHEI